MSRPLSLATVLVHLLVHIAKENCVDKELDNTN